MASKERWKEWLDDPDSDLEDLLVGIFFIGALAAIVAIAAIGALAVLYWRLVL